MNDTSAPSTTAKGAAAHLDRAALEAALTRAIERARALGADAVEAHGRTGTELSVTARNGEVDTVEHSEARALSVTVYLGGARGTAETNELTEPGIERTVGAALDIARFAESDPYAGLADPGDLATDFPDLDLFHPWDVDAGRLTELAVRMDDAARRADPRITQTDRSAISTTAAISGYASSTGFLAMTAATRHGISCLAIAQQGGAKERDLWYDTRRVASALAAPEAIGRRAGERTAARLGARQVPTGSYPVVFEAPVASTLIGHLVGAVSGANLYRKSSFLIDAIGRQILPERVSIVETPFVPRGYASAAYDSEGVKPSGGAIVDAGVLARYVLSSYSARRLSLATTGNAGGVRNLAVSHDDLSRDEIVRQMGRGVLVTELMGFGVNLVNGDYSRGASGYWVEDGEIRYPVNEFTIAGNLKDMLLGIVAIGSDVDDRGNTHCGSILIDRLTIAGS